MSSAFKDIAFDCKLEFVKDGEELSQYLKEKELPDIILMDLNMPKIDGREMLKILKSSELYAHLPVMVISTSTAEKEIKTAYREGAAAYIAKPADYDTLTELLRNLTSFFFKSVMLPKS